VAYLHKIVHNMLTVGLRQYKQEMGIAPASCHSSSLFDNTEKWVIYWVIMHIK